MNREIYTPDKFQPVPGYKDLTPQEISRSTSQLLNLYFSGIGFNLEPGREFLANCTLGHLRAAEQGFFTIFDKTRKLKRGDAKRINERGSEALAGIIDSEAGLAFGHALVIFAHLHEFEDQDFFISGFSRSMTLASPRTSVEYLDRIHELQFSVAGIATGRVRRDPRALQGSSQMVRTYAFFKVGDELTQKFTEKQLQAERETTTQETVQRLTADIPGLDNL
jgi:hypothetical protein